MTQAAFYQGMVPENPLNNSLLYPIQAPFHRADQADYHDPGEEKITSLT